MLKLSSIVFVVLIASTTHGLWLSELENQFYDVWDREIVKKMADHVTAINEKYEEVEKSVKRSIARNFDPMAPIVKSINELITETDKSVDEALMPPEDANVSSHQMRAAECKKKYQEEVEIIKKAVMSSVKECGDKDFDFEKIKDDGIKMMEETMMSCGIYRETFMGWFNAGRCYAEAKKEMDEIVLDVTVALKYPSDNQIQEKYNNCKTNDLSYDKLKAFTSTAVSSFVKDCMDMEGGIPVLK